MEEKWNFSDADRFYLKSLCSYYEGNLPNALTQLKQSLADDPNHIKAKMMHSRLDQQSRAKIDGTFDLFRQNGLNSLSNKNHCIIFR